MQSKIEYFENIIIDTNVLQALKLRASRYIYGFDEANIKLGEIKVLPFFSMEFQSWPHIIKLFTFKDKFTKLL